MKSKLLLLLFGLLLIVSCAKSIDNEKTTPPDTSPEVLPIVFHVLYEDEYSRQQNPPAQSFTKRIQSLNDYYSAKIPSDYKSTPINVQFALATLDPSGRTMAEPGIHRVRYTNSSNMSADAFLKSNHFAGSPNYEIFWNPNQYINVWVFGFSEELVTGISYLAYTPSTNSLQGLARGDGYFRAIPDYMHGIVLNNIYFEKDIHVIAHEMGHYLGLFHAFDENGGCATIDDASDDYCGDTPKYDRKAYDKMLEGLMGKSAASKIHFAAVKSTIQWEDLTYRTSCSGKQFVSTNLMDYDFGYLCCFTPQQRDRIEHVVKNSPLIPRKNNTQRAKMLSKGVNVEELPTPIIMR